MACEVGDARLMQQVRGRGKGNKVHLVMLNNRHKSKLSRHCNLFQRGVAIGQLTALIVNDQEF